MASEKKFTVGGVSTTKKNVLTLRVTNDYTARMRTFAADKDTGVVMVNLPQAMTKDEVAPLLASSEQFMELCVAAGYTVDAVMAYLKRQGSKAAAAIPTLAPTATADKAVNE